MPNFSRLQVFERMTEQGLVPLFYHADMQVCKDVAAACHRAGGRLLEFTNRGDFAHELFSELSKFVRHELPGMMLGAGSIAEAGTAALYMQLGANFIVSPALREDVALACNRRKVAYLPGCATLTEIGRAEELGCEVVKLFPGSSFAPQFVKDVKGPQPWTSIMPTGGVSPTEESLSAWFGAGVACVGMGSQLISKEVLEKRDFAALEKRVGEALETIRQVRQ